MFLGGPGRDLCVRISRKILHLTSYRRTPALLRGGRGQSGRAAASEAAQQGRGRTKTRTAAAAGARERGRAGAAKGELSPALPEQRLRAKRPDRFAKSGAGQKTPGHLRGGRAGSQGKAESVAQLRIHSRPDSTACAWSRWLPWASGCAACAVDQPWLRHIHSRVNATISFFAEADVGTRPGTEQFFECVHPCCDQ